MTLGCLVSLQSHDVALAVASMVLCSNYIIYRSHICGYGLYILLSKDLYYLSCYKTEEYISYIDWLFQCIRSLSSTLENLDFALSTV